MLPSKEKDSLKTPSKPQPGLDSTPSPLNITPTSRCPGILQFLHGIGRKVWAFLDMLCFALSPLAIIWFLIFAMVTLDELGQYVQFKRSIVRDGVVTYGTWSGADSDDAYAIVSFEKKENGYETLAIPLRYYSTETIFQLKEGQLVEVRYTFPPAHEMKGVLVSAYDEFDSYTGFITDNLWALALGWLVIIIRPEFLLLGLTKAPFEQAKNTGMRGKS